MNYLEFSKLPPEVHAEIEKAYRRGYAQAAYCAARDAQAGHDLKKWSKVCTDWRYAPTYGPRKLAAIGTPPPEPRELKK